MTFFLLFKSTYDTLRSKVTALASLPHPDSTSWTFNDEVYQRRSHDETLTYYVGLPSRPYLVATQHVTRFLHRGSPLVSEVLGILEGHNWTAVDILMVDCQAGTRGIRMLISMGVDSMKWHTGIWVAAQCKKTLENHGIKDIEVEVKESTITRAIQKHSPTPPHLESQPSEPILPFLGQDDDFLGQDDDFKTGAKFQISRHLSTQIYPEGGSNTGATGPYLSIKTADGQSNTAALTCRHVVFEEANGSTEYRHTPARPKIWMNQLRKDRLDRIQYVLIKERVLIDDKRRRLDKAVEDGDELAENEFRSRLLGADERYSDLSKFHEHLVQHSEESSRRFGHVVYAADQSTAPQGWFRDYALIALDMDAHRGSLRNTVWVPEMFNLSKMHDLSEDIWIKTHERWPGCTETMELSGHLTLQQVRSPNNLKDAQTMGDDNDQLIVGMVGSRSRAQFGIVNNIQSLTRRATEGDDCREVMSMKVCVTPMIRSYFAVDGDSGACVWSLDGRVVGIVTGGANARTEYADTTYVTTLENILTDLKDAGFEASLYQPQA